MHAHLITLDWLAPREQCGLCRGRLEERKEKNLGTL